MGASQSFNSNDSYGAESGGQVGTWEARTSYYEVLGVDSEATDDEIKSAYRKKALELHPDRNYGNVESATKQFTDIQAAYEILSDPQERAWYDAHKDTILGGGNSVSEEHTHNIRLTKADDIMRLLTKVHARSDFSDSADGFYSILRNIFDTVASEEDQACKLEGLDPIAYPSFGHANDNCASTVRPFYALWTSFATKKTFMWEDVYRLSEAPDRRVRRMMEKENKRLREEAIRGFNDAIRSLVAFAKKRDPRIKLNPHNEAERQRTLRKAAVNQAARSRAANRAKEVSPEAVAEWTNPTGSQEAAFSAESEEEIEEHFQCVVCKKSFKSEKQYEAHEKSKKHVRAVYHLQRQMQREDKNLNLDKSQERFTIEEAQTVIPNVADLVIDQEAKKFVKRGISNPGSREGKVLKSTYIVEEILARSSPENAHPTSSAIPLIWPLGDVYTAGKTEEQDILVRNDFDDGSSPFKAMNRNADALSEKPGTEHLEDDEEIHGEPKIGKAKEKRAKKLAQAESRPQFQCTSCQAGFMSKTRLFNHIQDYGHAQPMTKSM